jgi:predicted permease
MPEPSYWPNAINEEVRQHLDDRYAELRASGTPHEEAVRLALEELDGASPRDLAPPPLVDSTAVGAPKQNLLRDLGKDARFAIRMIRKNPGFAAVVVLTLALGIGANTALFSVVNGVLLRPLPFPHPEQLVALHESKANFESGSIPYPNFRDWQRMNHTFTAMAIMRSAGFTLTGRGEAEQVRAGLVTADLFRLLGVQPLAGRTFAPGEDEIGAAPVVLVGEGFWKRKLGGSPAAVGDSLALDGRNFTVIGIIPASFDLQQASFRPSDIYVPIGQWGNTALTLRSAGLGLHGVGRLKPGVSIEQARADMAIVGQNLSAAYPDANKGVGTTMVPLDEEVTGRVRPYLLTLVGAVAFVLLIACANVSSLSLARAVSRRREFAVRVALGANPARIVRQLVTESVVLALVGGALGLLAATWGTRAALAALPAAIPRASEVGLDPVVVGFTVGVSVLAGVLFGLAPAWRAARPDLHDTLKEGGRGTGSGRHRAQAVFVVAETALAVILLVGAGLMVRTLARLWNVNPGFRAENVLTFGVNLPSKRAASVEAIRAAERQLHDAIAHAPGVAAASLSWGSFPMNGDDEDVFWLEGQPKPASMSEMLWSLRYIVEPDYLAAMGIPLQRGRFFSPQDDEHAPAVVVVDDVFARKFFPDQDPIGRRLNLGDNEQPVIVGVVGHVVQYGLDNDETQSVRAQMYRPFMQMPDGAVKLTPAGMTVVVRSAGSFEDVLGAVRQSTARLAPDRVIYGAETMQEIIGRTLAARRFTMALFAVFALAALVLASLGIYGVLSHLVLQRTQEIGVRLALGATPSNVATLVIGEGLGLAGAGVAVGVGGALLLTRLMVGLLFRVSPMDPPTFLVVAGLLMVVALAACWLPARRATHADPLVALRSE